jgi:serine protease
MVAAVPVAAAAASPAPPREPASAARALTPAAPAPAPPDVVPGEVIVKYERGADPLDRRRVQRTTGVGQPARLGGGARELKILDGQSVGRTVRELNSDPNVKYAVPNYIARATATFNDPGRSGRAGGWTTTQWNFTGAVSVNAQRAWRYASQLGARGGRGAVVAIIDTGVAYENRGSFRRATDLYPHGFVRGYDFVGDDSHPNDQNGHGTFVTGTIAQRTNNRLGVTGLAFGAKIMPLRVLDRAGEGDAADIARALRYAARHGADVVNMSLEFDTTVTASQVPDVIDAINYAAGKGVVIVGASGNSGEGTVAYPARASHVISVGATTRDGCQADYSNSGSGLDIVAPGGGQDAPNGDNAWDVAHCRPGQFGPDIYQQTFACDPDQISCPSSYSKFGLPSGFEGTSMASPHVAAAAALVIASHRVGANPSAAAVAQRLEQTARDLGPPGRDDRYGAGLLDIAAALTP